MTEELSLLSPQQQQVITAIVAGINASVPNSSTVMTVSSRSVAHISEQLLLVASPNNKTTDSLNTAVFAYNPAQNRVAVAVGDGETERQNTIKLLRVKDFSLVTRLILPNQSHKKPTNQSNNASLPSTASALQPKITLIHFSRDGDIVAALTDITDRQLVVWKVSTKECLFASAVDSNIVSFTFNPVNWQQLLLFGSESLSLGEIRESLGKYSLVLKRLKMDENVSTLATVDSSQAKFTLTKTVQSVVWIPTNIALVILSSGVVVEVASETLVLRAQGTLHITEEEATTNVTSTVLTLTHLMVATAKGRLCWFKLSDFCNESDSRIVPEATRVLTTSCIASMVTNKKSTQLFFECNDGKVHSVSTAISQPKLSLQDDLLQRQVEAKLRIKKEEEEYRVSHKKYRNDGKSIKHTDANNETESEKQHMIKEYEIPPLSWHHFSGLVLSLLALTLPVVSGYNFSIYSSLANNGEFESAEFKIAAAALLLSSIPLLIEFVMDIIFSRLRSQEAYTQAINIGRNIIAFSFILCGAQLLALESKRSMYGFIEVKSAVYLFSMTFLGCVVNSTISFFICLCDPERCPPLITIIISLLNNLCAILQFYAVADVGGFGIFASVAVILVMSLNLLLWVDFSAVQWKKEGWSVQDVGVCMYLSISLMMTLLKIATMVGTGRILNLGIISDIQGFQVMLHIHLHTITVVMITFVPQRLAKINDIALKDSIIETKRSYIRFISHEMRTPVNIVSLGLKLCLDKIPENSKKLIDKEQATTLEEITSACDAALAILNELLLLDKVEDGLLQLSREHVNIKDTVSNAIDIFAVQMREKNINLITEGLVDEVATKTLRMSNKYIADRDEVFIDKNKIQQVIRNVLSNAIKFTPTGGNIFVRVKFSERLPQSAPVPEDDEPSYTIRDTLPFTFQNSTNKVSPEYLSVVDHKDNPNYRRSTSMATRALKEVGFLVIQIKDSGAGLSEEEQKKLFKEIVQFRPEVLQNGGGSGLGMWISHNIMQLHGGSISVSSAGHGHGATFTLAIPMKRNLHEFEADCRRKSFDAFKPNNNVYNKSNSNILQDDCAVSLSRRNTVAVQRQNTGIQLFDLASLANGEDRRTISPTILSPQVSFSSRYRPLRLLLVDDSAMNRKMLSKMLVRKKHECVEAEDGLIALDMIRALGANVHFYDAILMDYMMPNMDGPTATCEIRKLGYTKPIIGVTGHALKGDQEYFIASGASCIFTKPVDIKQIQQVFYDRIWSCEISDNVTVDSTFSNDPQ